MSIALTLGEPAGIGADLIILYAQKNLLQNLLVFSDPDLLLTRSRELNLPIKITEKKPSKQNEICVFPIKANSKIEPGVLNPDNVPFVLETLKVASQCCLDKTCSALLTGPVNKGVINQAGFSFTGHTEYLATLTNTDKTVMMLAANTFRVALATTHIPLSEVPRHIQTNTLNKTIDIIHQALVSMGIQQPNITVCGLNPHAGEGGHLGREEIEIINPLIKKLNNSGYHIKGCVPADTAFTPDALHNTDVVLAMYHDQGLPTLKALGFKKAVNITLGLPFIRASVAHGTALNLSATGNISLGSFEMAFNYVVSNV